MYLSQRKFLTNIILIAMISLPACQPKNQTIATNHDDNLVGCYTVSPSEPAQIKINHEKTINGEKYTMQMREFNDPTKNWDTPTPMQILSNNNPEIQQFFDIQADEHQFVEKVISREDKMFVLAKVTDSFARLNPQFDSPYLGFIYKDSNTIFKVSCDNLQQV